MAINQGACVSFKQELLGGIHDLDTDTLRVALYTSAADLGPSTTVYTSSNEVAGPGYTAGGQAVTGATISVDGTTAFLDFDDPLWEGASITARGALLYNASKANRAIAVFDFGVDRTATAGPFQLILPVPAAGTALVRIP